MVGAELNFPPFGFKADNGQPAGFEVDLLNAIAKEENFVIQFVPILRDSFIEGLENKVYQMAVAAIAINAERSSQIDFSDSVLDYQRKIYLLDNEKIKI